MLEEFLNQKELFEISSPSIKDLNDQSSY